MSHDDDLYSSLWGEPPPQDAGGPPAAGSDRKTAEASAPPPGPHSDPGEAAPSGEPASDLRQVVSPRTAMVQHQMAETLKRLEARVGALQNRIEPLTAEQLQEAVAELAELSTTLRRAVTDLEGMLDYSRAIVQELADIQAQAHRGLTVIHEQINVLDRYGRRYPA